MIHEVLFDLPFITMGGGDRKICTTLTGSPSDMFDIKPLDFNLTLETDHWLPLWLPSFWFSVPYFRGKRLIDQDIGVFT